MSCQVCYGCHERCNACGAGLPQEEPAARRVAAAAHAGQTDKAGKPYVVHLGRVAARLPEELRAAGWLHDVLEDTPTTPEDLARFGFSRETIAAIEAVTRRPGETYAEFIERVARSGPDAVSVKIADVRDHLEHSPEAIPESLRRRYLRALTRLLRASLDA